MTFLPGTYEICVEKNRSEGHMNLDFLGMFRNFLEVSRKRCVVEHFLSEFSISESYVACSVSLVELKNRIFRNFPQVLGRFQISVKNYRILENR